MKKNQNYCVLKIKNIAPSNINSLLDYFEKYYIGKAVPLLPIHIWNINDRVLQDFPRTNNSLESWHKQFEIDAKKHQTVFKDEKIEAGLKTFSRENDLNLLLATFFFY
ncbi:hypothetical protein BpHYR1_008321 [Brachionus plicatilis]|uniref:Uncharacterized protein n=1 Tax=Brachionus plicatilis TaxID=10195 RepID=A0A3M7QKV7_BRAPC|nr:hypothetical protein BpHYR1_008321 [Brachionus plicatilis]